VALDLTNHLERNKMKSLAYKMRSLDIRKGNVYDYLSEDEINWLVDEAVKINRCDLGLVISSIVSDAYNEEVIEKTDCEKGLTDAQSIYSQPSTAK